MSFGVAPGKLMDRALQQAGVVLESLVLRIDLTRLLESDDEMLLPLAPWARKRLDESHDGVAELHPVALRELATAFGYDPKELGQRLAPLNTRYPELSNLLDEPESWT
jgi:hypothetical protein